MKAILMFDNGRSIEFDSLVTVTVPNASPSFASGRTGTLLIEPCGAAKNSSPPSWLQTG